jgi:hypothetical protein
VLTHSLNGRVSPLCCVLPTSEELVSLYVPNNFIRQWLGIYRNKIYSDICQVGPLCHVR